MIAVDKQLLDEWVFERAVERGHRRFVPIRPAETAGRCPQASRRRRAT